MLWEEQPEVMRAALQTHDAALRGLLQTWRGYEVKTEGDAFMCAFADAADAVGWAVAVQRALVDATWPAPLADGGHEPLWRGLRVRAGVHVGNPDCRPDPLTGRMDYFGPVVNRAARIAHAAHGGQVLVSGAAWKVAGDALRATLAATDLGEHRLRGLSSPERLWQVLPASLAGRAFPPPRTELRPRTNLTPPPGALLGRDRLLASLIGATRDASARWIAVTGPPGVGKSRLVHEAAWQTLAEWPGGAIRCDLTSVSSEDELCATVAGALEVPVADGDPVARLGAALSGRGRSLLVLDNAESSVEAVIRVARSWIAAAPALVLIVASRAVLGARERNLPVPVLPVPAIRASEEEIRQSPSVQLFVTRAREVAPAFDLDGERLLSVARLVRLLDGLPLAIELVAARSRILAPDALFHRLSAGRASLGGTLEAAWQGAWDDLDPEPRAALAQLSLFEGEFSVEAVDAVLRLEHGDALDALQNLVDRSLVQSILDEGTPRFLLLNTVRAYARARLGDDVEAYQRHADWASSTWDPARPRVGGVRADLRAAFDRVARWLDAGRADELPRFERVAAALLGHLTVAGVPEETVAVASLVLDRPVRASVGLEASLTRAQARWTQGRAAEARAELEAIEVGGSAEVAVRRLRRLWQICRQSGEGAYLREVYEHALSLRPSGRWALELAVVSIDLDRWEGGPPEAAIDRYERVEAGARVGGWLELAGCCANDLGSTLLELGRPREARRAFGRAIADARVAHHYALVAIAAGNSGLAARALGEPERARTLFRAAMSDAREMGLSAMQVSTLGYLAITDLDCGNAEAARELLVEARQRAEVGGLSRIAGNLCGQLGLVSLDLGEIDEARRRLDEALSHHRATANRNWEAWTLAVLAQLELDVGRVDAARAALAAGRRCGSLTPMAEAALLTVESRLCLTEATTDAARRARQIADHALRILQDRGDPAERVLALVARGEAELALGDTVSAQESAAEAERCLLDRSLRRASLVSVIRGLQRRVEARLL